MPGRRSIVRGPELWRLLMERLKDPNRPAFQSPWQDVVLVWRVLRVLVARLDLGGIGPLMVRALGLTRGQRRGETVEEYFQAKRELLMEGDAYGDMIAAYLAYLERLATPGASDTDGRAGAGAHLARPDHGERPPDRGVGRRYCPRRGGPAAAAVKPGQPASRMVTNTGFPRKQELRPVGGGGHESKPPECDRGRGGGLLRARCWPGPRAGCRCGDVRPISGDLAPRRREAKQPGHEEGSQRGVWDLGLRTRGAAGGRARRARAERGQRPDERATAMPRRGAASSEGGELLHRHGWRQSPGEKGRRGTCLWWGSRRTRRGTTVPKKQQRKKGRNGDTPRACCFTPFVCEYNNTLPNTSEKGFPRSPDGCFN